MNVQKRKIEAKRVLKTFPTFAPVKNLCQVIATLLAVIFMALTFMPCADGCDNDSHQTELTVNAAQEHHEEHNDVCSPLCSCSCCSTQITVTYFSSLTFITHEVFQTFPVFKQPFISSFFYSIWQPPKIS